jgi:hypothetical protein
MLLGAVGILVWGFSGGSSSGADPAERRPIVNAASGGTRIADADVAALAREMTAGLQAGDFDAYAASFDLDLNELAHQRMVFDNLEQLPLSRKEVVALDFNGRAFDSAGKRVRTKAEVALVHQFDGADLTAVSEAYELDLVRSGPKADVRVVGMKGEDSGATLYPQPWDLGPIHVVAAERAIVIGTAEDAALLDTHAAAISDGAGSALDELSQVDPRPFPRRVVVAVPGTGKDAYSVFLGSSPNKVVEAAGVAVDQLSAPYEDIEGNRIESGDNDSFQGAGRISLDRVYVGRGGAFLTELSRHETTHLAQYVWRAGNSDKELAYEQGENTWAIDDLPRWMIEGFADYVGNGYLGAVGSGEYRLALAAARRPGFAGLPHGGPQSFYEGSLDDVNARYGLGMTAFMYVEATRGRPTALSWAHALFHAPSLEAVDRTYADVLQTTPAAFEAAWSSWLRSQA